MTSETEYDTVSYIKALLDPINHGQFQPPNGTGRNLISQKVNVNGNLTVDDSTLIDEACRYDTGGVLMLPQRGVIGIYAMGFCPAGTVSQPTIGTRGFVPFLSNTIGFTYNGTLALPRGHTNMELRTSPNLEDNFSLAAAYTGIFRIYSDTISTTATTLTGRVSAGALGDTREVAQRIEGGSSFAFAPVDLASQSVGHSYIEEQTIDKGVVALIGPDGQHELGPPTRSKLDTINGEWGGQYFIHPDTIAVPMDQGQVGTFKGVQNLGCIFITPWDIECNWNPTPVPFVARAWGDIFTPTVKLPNIDEGGLLDFDVCYSWSLEFKSGSGGYRSTVGVSVTAEHWFVKIADNGSLEYFAIDTSNSNDVLTMFGDTPGDKETSIGVNAVFSPKALDQNMNIIGKYIGTTLSVNGRVLNSTGDGTSIANVILDSFSVVPRARQIQEPGNTGPARFLRWDSVGQKRNIRFSGTLWARAVAQSNIATFTASAALNAKDAGPSEADQLATELFNSGFFKRIYDGEDYDHIVRDIVPDLTPTMLKQEFAQDPKMRSRMAAAGFDLSGIGSTLGGALGTALGGPTGGSIGSALGGLAGAIGQDVMGAAGQWGTGQPRSMGASGHMASTAMTGWNPNVKY